MKLYHIALEIKRDRPNETFLEIISEIIKTNNLDYIDVALEIKRDKTMLDLIRKECIELKLIKENDTSLDMNCLF